MNNDFYREPSFTRSLCTLALDAGRKILDLYRGVTIPEFKADASPVTGADRAAEAVILKGLSELYPAIPVLAEEHTASHGVPTGLGDMFFLVDPLDGTREFIDGTGEFTVNIGLSLHGIPVCGVVHAPVLKSLYAGTDGSAAWRADVDDQGKTGTRRHITTRPPPEGGLVAVASRSHRSRETDGYLKAFNITSTRTAGSSLKFCLIAEGLADIYPRLGRTMEWDTAAGQAVLEAAGGEVRTYPDNGPLRYGKSCRGHDNPSFIASGTRQAEPATGNGKNPQKTPG